MNQSDDITFLTILLTGFGKTPTNRYITGHSLDLGLEKPSISYSEWRIP
jgi:hypothetical protein